VANYGKQIMNTPMKKIADSNISVKTSVDAEREEHDSSPGEWLLLLQAAGSITLLINRALRFSGLNLDTWLLLESLHGRPRRPSELARAVGGPRGSVSRRIGRLQDLGLVSVQLSLDDRRVKSVRITQDGTQVLETARGHIEAALRPVSDWLGDTEHDHVTDYHRRLLKVVRSQMYGRSPQASAYA